MSKQFLETQDTLQSFYDSATVMMGIVELSGDDIRHISDNQAAATFFETTPEAIQGQLASTLGVPPEYVQMWLEAYRASEISDEPVRFDYEHKGKGWLKVTVNAIGLISGRQRFSYVVDDITDRKEVEQALQEAHDQLEARVRERTRELEQIRAELETVNQQLQHDAYHDALTGLANRLLFTNRLHHAIERYQREPELGFTVLFMDLDHFKVINDSLGHATGDELLVAVGQRLLECLRDADTVARLGGDEFVMLLEHCDAVRAAEVVARLQQALAPPFELRERSFTLTGSVGVVFSEAGHQHPQDLLRDADLAMYRAKVFRSGRYEIFAPGMRQDALHRLNLEAELRKALEQHALEVVYQPILRLSDLQLSGFEALVRWQHPQLGPLLPGAFIPLAEETGLIIKLDRQVLSQASRQFGLWQQAFPKLINLSLNINFSSQHFIRGDLLSAISQTLSDTGLRPQNLNLEITESLLMQPTRAVDEVVEQLVGLGVQLCIDDFGTGYASLGYLQRFPAHILKIDRSFTQGLDEGSKGMSLVKAIVSMARSLGVGVVAEGVETKTQLAQLQKLGCEYGQGYLFAKPGSEAETTTFVENILAHDSLRDNLAE